LEAVQELIKSRNAKIGIIGLGYVGIPLAIRFMQERFQVVGFDVDEKKISKLKEGESFIRHIPSADIQNFVESKQFTVTSDFGNIANCDVIIICVPTPLTIHREPDLSYIETSCHSCLPHLKKNQLMVLESTTYPGTTDEILKPIIESKGFKVGKDFYLAFSPEREDPGRTDHSTRTIPKVVGGVTPDCLKVATALYGCVIQKIVPVSSARAAEMTKLLENIHRAVNIGLVNELKVVCDKMNIDIHEIIDAAATKPFGFVAYRPGPGLGGHCIPIDPFYLTWKAREFDLHTRFIELAGEVNSNMPAYVLSKILFGLNKQKKSCNGSKVLILGLAYKKNIDDARESPSLPIIKKLQELGALVSYVDPYVDHQVLADHRILNVEKRVLAHATIMDSDCIVIATDHDCFDYELLLAKASLVIDTRGRYRSEHENVVKA
jgi:UDP-N-acetyl-D-glucosamine dehydrogenase